MLINLDPTDPRPLYQQIADAIKHQVSDGTLPAGEGLPSVRELAGILEVNLHTVHQAYRTLRDEGVIVLRLGQRARIAERRRGPADPREVEQRLVQPLRRLLTDGFHLGLSADDLRQLVDQLLDESDSGGRS